MVKEESYKWSLKQVQVQIKRHTNIVATLANTAAILKERFPNYFWVGFYFLEGRQLVLGPFQGPPACMRLSLDSGVCATAVNEKKTIIVPDVHRFEGHVACDSRSNSEIVVPGFNTSDEIMMVLDIDSEKFDAFNETDKKYLEIITEKLRSIWK
jgi:L-methionine (R)-S-oxide reductase